MRSFLLFVSWIAASSASPMAWSPEMAAFYSETSASILNARSIGIKNPPSCDLSNVNITAYLATIPDAPVMKDPGKGKLVQVTVGRGVQNYTCTDSRAETKPVLLGAVANLYNVSCIAANHPHVLSLIPMFAVQYNTSLDSNGKLPGTNIARTGHHFFNAGGSPVFDLNDDKDSQIGVIVADGKNAVDRQNAPKSAVKGQIRASIDGQSGAVPWLMLKAKEGTTEDLANVYRVDTAGGQPPSSCAGRPSQFSVEYAAQYWFFKSV